MLETVLRIKCGGVSYLPDGLLGNKVELACTGFKLGFVEDVKEYKHPVLHRV